MKFGICCRKGGVFMAGTAFGTSHLKSSRSVWDTIPAVILTTYLLFIAGTGMNGIFSEYVQAGMFFCRELRVVVEYYYSFIFMWIPYVFFMLIYRPDHALLKKLVPGRGKKLLLFPAGILLGFALNAVCVLIAFWRKDIHLYFASVNPLHMIFAFAGVLIQSGAEEIQMRLFAQQHLARGYQAAWISVLLPSVFFSLLHLSNPGIGFVPLLCIFLAGICFSLIVHLFDSIWMAIAVHTMWNYTQNFLFGLPNSGIVSGFSLFRLEASTARNTFSYNARFGIEGAWVAVGVLFLADAVLLITSLKKTGKANITASPVDSDR